jgi:hypothetical protein
VDVDVSSRENPATVRCSETKPSSYNALQGFVIVTTVETGDLPRNSKEDSRRKARLPGVTWVYSPESTACFPETSRINAVTRPDQRTNVFVAVGAQSFYFDATRLAGRFGAGIFARTSSANWMIARINPGKRLSSSAQREMLCISTPWRSLRIRPASRSILKCCESVDFGIALSLTFRKFEQFCGQSCATMSAYIATRTGSDKAWRIPSTVTSSIEGWNSGRITY